MFESDGIVWLFDDSARTYICSSQPMIFIEPLYWMDAESDDNLPDATYIDPDAAKDAIAIRGDFPADLSEKEAWDDAREHAQGNHYM